MVRRLRGWAGTLAVAAADARRLAPIGCSAVRTIGFVVRMRVRPSAASPTAVFRLGDVRLEARPRDWCAVEEVLLDGEYDFVARLFADRPPGTVLDLGANVGAFSARCLSLWPGARVLAAEAAADTFALLERNRARNPACDWRVVQAALWNEDGSVVFAAAAQSTGSTVARAGEQGERVPALRLATLLDRSAMGTVDLLKMDIEGAEEAVLLDEPALLDRVGTVIVEVHPQRCDHDRVVALLRERFTTLAFVPGRRSSKPLLVAARRSLPLPEYHGTAAPARAGSGLDG
jgi:FkbM family methyltransferase